MATRGRAAPTSPTKAFGAQLLKLRGARSRGEICRRVKRFGLTLDRTTLLKYERGSVAAPDPAILWALGRIYHLDSVDELLTVLVMDRSGRALRSGLDITGAALTAAQLHIAEVFGTLPAAMQAALSCLISEMAPSESDHRVPRRRRTPRAATTTT